jgi:hypothetical protein
LSKVSLRNCPRCGVPHVPPDVAERVRAGEHIEAEIVYGSGVAGNVLKHGTGAINVDGCRVAGDIPQTFPTRRSPSNDYVLKAGFHKTAEETAVASTLGRWPANLIHDGSDEVVRAFPETTSGEFLPHHQAKGVSQIGTFNIRDRSGETHPTYGDAGSAARFFQQCPWSEEDRDLAERENSTRENATSAPVGRWPANLIAIGNSIGQSAAEPSAANKRLWYSSKAADDSRLGSSHPTVKPLSLISYLCRLICPPGGVVLDCFAGTGTTAEAAIREGMKAILIEREPAYLQDIERRMGLVMSGPVSRRHASIKAKGRAEEPLPLFAEVRQPQ